MYLVVNEENTDITEKCSYTEPYIYECTGEDGLRCLICGHTGGHGMKKPQVFVIEHLRFSAGSLYSRFSRFFSMKVVRK